MILPGNLLKYWQEVKVIDGCRRHYTHIRCKIYDTDSEHEGTTNNNVRDLGLNLQPRLIRHIPLGAAPAAGRAHITYHDSTPAPRNHSRENSHRAPQVRYVQTGIFIFVLFALTPFFTYYPALAPVVRLHLNSCKTQPGPARASKKKKKIEEREGFLVLTLDTRSSFMEIPLKKCPPDTELHN